MTITKIRAFVEAMAAAKFFRAILTTRTHTAISGCRTELPTPSFSRKLFGLLL